MEYVLTDVTQTGSIRRYGFAEIAKDVRRPGLSVEIDLDAVRRYKIPLQDLPLLCCNFLTEQRKAGSDGNLVYGESEMISHAAQQAEAAREAQLRRNQRKPSRPSRPKAT
jgi:hypothetical protein